MERHVLDRYLTAFSLDFRSTGKWVILAATIGVFAGLAGILFECATRLLQHLTVASWARFPLATLAGEHEHFAPPDGPLRPAVLLLILAVGGAVAAVVYNLFPSKSQGHGTDTAIDAFHRQRGRIPPRVMAARAIASVVTLGTCGSAGREGPIAQIGAGVGSWIATRLGLSDRDRRILLAAGMSAGVGAVFRAPLAGALFAGEILYRDADLDSDVIVPAAIASTVSYNVYTMSLSPDIRHTPLFGSELHFRMTSSWELLTYGAMAILLAAAVALFVWLFEHVESLFKSMPIHRALRAALGATLTGGIGLAFYFAANKNPLSLGVLASGYGTLQSAVSHSPPVSPTVWILVGVAFLKMITTSLTVGSGGAGGLFGPSVVIGGCLGGATGLVCHQFLPGLVTDPQAYAIVGMAGFYAGAANTPFSTVIMVSELTGDYQLLLPTMWVATLTFLLSTRSTLYKSQVRSRTESPAHRGDFIVDVLEGIQIRDVYRKHDKIIKIPEAMTMKGIVHTLAMTEQRYFPVVDGQDNMVGIFSAEDVRSFLYDESIWELANARDVMVSNFISVLPSDDLNQSMRYFTMLNVDELPVMDPENPRRLQGMLRRKEAIAAYNRRVMEFRQDGVGEGGRGDGKVTEDG